MATRTPTEDRFNSAHSTSCFSRQEESCFCLPWSPEWNIPERSIAPDEEEVKYSDVDLANELNQLTTKEREAVTEDIHGLSGEIPESPPFAEEKLKEFWEVLENLSANVVKRAAWDRAVFLRPSLQSDRELALLFLRAKRFDAYDAVQLLFKSYETKQFLFGEESLIHRRIRWDDLTELEQTIARTPYCIHLPRNKENTHKEICVFLQHRYKRPWPLNSLLRATLYEMYWAFETKPYLQRKGRIAVVDARGTMDITHLERIRFARDGIPVLRSLPIHTVCYHFLLDDSEKQFMVNTMQSLLPPEARVRVRVHSGSWTEIQYSLRTFGIDIPFDSMIAQTNAPSKDTSTKNPFSQESIDETMAEYRSREKVICEAEEILCDPSLPTTLYPNPQDILLGKNRRFAAIWPGTVAYTKLIQQYASAYLASASRAEKTMMCHTILNVLTEERNARFLKRQDSHWEKINDADARFKISQSLRDEARILSKQIKTTLNAVMHDP